MTNELKNLWYTSRIKTAKKTASPTSSQQPLVRRAALITSAQLKEPHIQTRGNLHIICLASRCRAKALSRCHFTCAPNRGGRESYVFPPSPSQSPPQSSSSSSSTSTTFTQPRQPRPSRPRPPYMNNPPPAYQPHIYNNLCAPGKDCCCKPVRGSLILALSQYICRALWSAVKMNSACKGDKLCSRRFCVNEVCWVWAGV